MHVVKPMVLGTSRKHWKRNLLQNLVKHKAMLMLTPPEDSNTSTGNIHLPSLKVYPTVATLLSELAQRKPVSALVEKSEGKIYAIYQEGSMKNMLLLVPMKAGIIVERFGMVYHEFDYTSLHGGTTDTVDVECYAVLLPLQQQDVDDKRMYTVVCNTWKVLNKDGRFVMPHMYMDMSKNKWQD